VGFARKRTARDGASRYAAVYRDARGQVRQAGTFSTKKDANLAWQRAEVAVSSGRPGDPRRGRVTVAAYVNEEWFPNHVVEPSTREEYRYCLDRHILPWFGNMKMADVLPTHVRQWVTELVAQGVSPAQIRHLKIILSAVFTTALNDFVTTIHPCRGVKSPTVPVKVFRIVTPGEYARLVEALPCDAARLFLEVEIGSGLRWGELTELRARDLQLDSGILTISRTVSEVNPKYHPTGGRFYVKPYPKSKHSRRLKLDPDLVDAIAQHNRQYDTGLDDLIFRYLQFSPTPATRPALVDAETLGLTDPTPGGRRYPHGTLSAYTAGSCRCEQCKASIAHYRAQRRSQGHDEPRGTRVRDTDGHLPRDWFRHRIWQPACQQAGFDPPIRVHDLRHSHASWLLAGGADLQVVRERLGHASIATTSKYLHTLPEADDTALTALRKIRST
jgi:integrase